ncbi:hypothetical protein Bca101_037900 [Brassica carinata]
MVVYKGSEERKEAKKKAETDGGAKKRGRPKKDETDGTTKKKAETDGAAKKKGRPRKESANLVEFTPRKKRKPPWLQSPFTNVKTEDIEGPTQKRKTKA